MRLMTKSFKVVADEDVRPLILTSRPQAGENLIGYISRVMADQAFSSLSAGLSLAGIGCTKPHQIASLLRDEGQIANLATLLDLPLTELQAILEPTYPRSGTRISVTRYFGMEIASRYRTFERRVSPRALSNRNVHQARWSLRLLNFDPVSRELLLTSCPACLNPLSWWRSFGTSKCDKCLDEDGRPLIDLRDYPQPLIDIDDEQALNFVKDIVHYDRQVRERAAGCVGSLWRGLSPSDVFETLVALTWAKESLLEQNLHLGRPTRPDQYASLKPQDVLQAASILLGEQANLSRYIEEARGRVGENAVTNGAKASFGRVGCLPDDQYLPPLVKEVVTQSLEAARTSLGIPRRGGAKLSHVSRAGRSKRSDLIGGLKPGYTRLAQAASLFGMSAELLGKAILLVDAAPHTQRRAVRTIGVDVAALTKEFPDIFLSVGPSDAAAMLKVPASGLATLARAGLLTESVRVTRGSQTYRRYSRSSVEGLIAKLQQLGTPMNSTASMTMRQAMATSKWPYADSAAAIIYMTRFDFNLVRLEGAYPDWRDGICLCDTDHFVREATRLRKQYASESEHLSRAEVCQILGCSYWGLVRLEKSGLVQPVKGPMKHARYVRTKVERFIETYVLFNEVQRRCELRGPRQIFFILSGFGLKPELGWGEGHPLVFRRDRFSRVLRALQKSQAAHDRAA